ncbi:MULTISPECIES: ABC transporter substrate-binding protein [unclassified Rathayibacter]|uniref:ABC transporter substrate-binding protein n=1 Tax=unclassified Rathayibacter TaxID=2609250 RepID=UPI001FB3E3B9|nr:MULTISPECIES: extracellular solute-binding protein [unclassified Rathayibacter]MCJ1674612.1 extracellular solute-binding protein [Rathayibacter sp. VKM Ac-2929]MCJ1684892.1 extracellular solute-binding protein [Rathayibacter sp. VKM Ac-2928]
MQRRSAMTLAIMGITVLTLAGCVGSDDTGPTAAVTEEDIAQAMETPTELTFWTWVPGIEDEVALFEERYPAIDVTVENLGQGTTQHQILRTALEAGEGAPDLAQIEYQLLPSFVLTDSLLDLAPYGADELAGDYVDWVWNQVSPGEEVWAIPQDIGPMGNLYREDILTTAGITEPPATWDEYADAAEAVKSETGSYISNMGAAQANQFIAFFWQRGVQPFSYDGAETVSIDVNGPEAKEIADYWTDLIQRDLVSTDADFNDQWYQGLANGTYAGWLTAAWGPLFLEGTAGATSGLWRAAPLPQWSASEDVSGSWGGSSNVVLATTENPIAAAELAKFINHDPESTALLASQQFLFPSTTDMLENPDFTGAEPEFYGGQRVNELFADIAGTVDTDFQWLPFMEYVQASFEENVTPVLSAKGDLADALDAWQDDLVTYAEAQGFTVD